MSANVPSAQTGVSTATWMNGTPSGISTGAKPRNSRMIADERDDERPEIERAARRRAAAA